MPTAPLLDPLFARPGDMSATVVPTRQRFNLFNIRARPTASSFIARPVTAA